MWFLLVIAVVALYVVFTYNGLVTLRQRVRNAWAQVDVQLKRRYDLIPNLVNTVQGYAQHEKGNLCPDYGSEEQSDGCVHHR